MGKAKKKEKKKKRSTLIYLPEYVDDPQEQESHGSLAQAHGPRDRELAHELELCRHHDAVPAQSGVVLAEPVEGRHQHEDCEEEVHDLMGGGEIR